MIGELRLIAKSSPVQAVSNSRIFQSEKILNWFDVMCIGISIVTPGITGWSSAYLVGGWGGLFFGTLIISVLFCTLVLNLMELSTTFPVAGGSYAYASMTMGKYIGMLTGLTEASEFTIISAYWIFQMDSIIRAAFDLPDYSTPLLWVMMLALAFFISVFRGKLVGRVLSTLVLAYMLVNTVLLVDELDDGCAFSNALNINVTDVADATPLLPMGGVGILANIPSGTWFFLGTESMVW